MVQIIPRAPTSLERFMQALSGGLQGATSGAESIQNMMREKAQRKTLQERFGSEFGNIHDPDLRKQLLSGAIDKENILTKMRGEYEADQQNYQSIKDTFGKKFADIWLAMGQGERTALTNSALKARGRGIDLDKILSNVREDSSASQEDLNDIFNESPSEGEDIFEELAQITSGQDKGLLPEEKVARGKERYATGLKEYQEAGTKLQGMARDKERLDILENLNNSNKLPKNLERLNVDKEGNLKLPFLASAEAQRYVKTLNEFSAGAKDTFGSRVTNFDLAQYLKRYPTLLNTKEGRRQLLDQMKIVNQINSVYYKNLRKVYDKAGGVRSIDSDVAERVAEQMSESKVNTLSEKFKQIGQFSSKPNPSEFKGKKIRDKETGEVFVSDGENWIPE